MATPEASPPQDAPPRPRPDCMTCRVTGTVMMGGISAYCLWERAKLPVEKVGDRRMMAGLAGVTALLSAYRGFGW